MRHRHHDHMDRRHQRPERDDAEWSGHLDVIMRDGETTCAFSPAAPSDGEVHP